MKIAAIIPYRPGADHNVLAWTLEGYGRQVLNENDSVEIHVGVDGGDSALGDAVAKCIAASKHPITVRGFPWIGASAARNALVRGIAGPIDLLIFGNADARPDPDMVRHHAIAMSKLPPRSLVLGAAPWERNNPTVIDTLIDHTPMIFSYCHMETHRLYPFRSAYSLNLSARKTDFDACGGFPEEIRPYYYEDLAFGCRMIGGERLAVLYYPEARVLHRHPMTLEQYLDREELLGIMAPVLARCCPEAFAVSMAGRSVQDIAADFRAKVKGDSSVYRQIYRRMKDRYGEPDASLGQGDARAKAIESLYQLHVPVKLLAFRLGFLKGLELVQDTHWQIRKPQGLWRERLL